jgi:hypothetical protein
MHLLATQPRLVLRRFAKLAKNTTSSLSRFARLPTSSSISVRRSES